MWEAYTFLQFKNNLYLYRSVAYTLHHRDVIWIFYSTQRAKSPGLIINLILLGHYLPFFQQGAQEVGLSLFACVQPCVPDFLHG